MMSGISSMGNCMAAMALPPANGQQGPGGPFAKIDSDGSGGISETELAVFADDISAATGDTIDTTDALSTYDSDGDGTLNGEEMKSFMTDTGLRPPPNAMAAGGMAGISPQSSMNQAMSAYQAGGADGDDTLAVLLEELGASDYRTLSVTG